MPDDKRPPKFHKTTPRGVPILSDDHRDRIIHKHKTPELAAPHEVPEETTGMHRQRTLDSIQIQLNNVSADHKELRDDVVDIKVSQAHTLGKLGLLDVLMTRMTAQDRTLDVIARKRAVTDIGDDADAKKQRRTVLTKLIVAAIGVVAIIVAALVKGCT